MANGVTEAPYNDRGDLQHYPGYGTTEWRVNEPFTAKMTFSHFEHGRSVAYAILTDREGHQFPMFLSDFAEAIRESVFMTGGVTGLTQPWIVKKRGQNYGVALAPAP